jgi:hypothetical protein
VRRWSIDLKPLAITLAIGLALLVLLAVPALAQPRLPQRVDTIVQALYERHTALSHGDDNQRRALTKMVAEQVFCELRGGWGWKSASPTRPPSKDAIALKDVTGFHGWDLFNGSTRKPIKGGLYHDLNHGTPQHFIAVSAVDHLGTGCTGPGTPPPPPPDPDPEPPPTEDPTRDAILAELRAINAKFELLLAQQAMRDAELRAAIEELRKQVEAGVRIRF